MHGRRYSSSALTLQLTYEILSPSFAFLQIIYPLVHDLNQFSTQFKIERHAYVSVLIQRRNPGIIKPLGRGGVHQVVSSLPGKHTEDKQLTFTPKVCLKWPFWLYPKCTEGGSQTTGRRPTQITGEHKSPSPPVGFKLNVCFASPRTSLQIPGTRPLNINTLHMTVRHDCSLNSWMNQVTKLHEV